MKLGIFVTVLLIVGMSYFIYWAFPTASNIGYQPEQPIPFSHKIHAGTHKIDCQYCHVGVETSQHATVPSMNVCMNCHQVVAQESPHIQKLKDYYKKGKPIPWVRIHELPDFVSFPHHVHVNKGLSCESCHGNIKGMDKVYQAQDLTMGWCLDCHRGRTTPRKILAETHPNLKKPQGHPVATDACVACHY